jgi:streptogramin lyase
VREKPNLPPKTQLTWGWNQLILKDQAGDWWIPTAQGIYRFSGMKSFSELATAKPRAYSVKDGMGDNQVFRLFEDARGDLWFSTLGNVGRELNRWERSSDRFHVYTSEEIGVPAVPPTAFVNDSGGNLWIGFYTGYVCRYANGQFTLFTEKDGVPRDFVRDMLLDSKKRLWIATNSALLRVDDPLARQPQFISYTAKHGRASDQATTLIEDRWGQIYVGTGRGLDRLDPDSGKIKHYTTADGLADNFVNVSMRDSQGALWFGTYRGLSRLVPNQDKALAPPPIIISGLRVAGVRQTLSELGETYLQVPELSYRQNQLQIDFLSISYAPGDVLRYQFKLESSGTDWSVPSDQHTITLANMAPGTYRFLARAINSDGVTSSQPASVSFRILPPIWLRWWFLTLSSAVVATIAITIIRQRTARRRERERARDDLREAREQRLHELEQVRSRIAADLHDDIGSNLTRISLISEVAQRKLDGADRPSASNSPASVNCRASWSIR